ncbi:UNVERIFIED_CONTAM: aminotransferase class III-fold pyridoxal phosphate-dependent enzyme, partial [Salmonella enterica subsp. enterica serovar Weltevreden]
VANVKARGEQMRQGLEAIGRRYGLFGGVRGMGLLLGAPLTDDWKGRAKDVVAAGLRQGVWLLVAGPDVLRFAPALTISEAE